MSRPSSVQQRKTAKRAFTGLAGSPLSKIRKLFAEKSDHTLRVPKTPIERHQQRSKFGLMNSGKSMAALIWIAHFRIARLIRTSGAVRNRKELTTYHLKTIHHRCKI